MSFEVDVSDLERLKKDLKVYAARAVPFATRNTLNAAAFDAMKLARDRVAADMILRRPFTKTSIRVDRARTLDIKRQFSTVGSIAPYMEDQEFGATIHKKHKHGVPIPTSFAAGQGMNTNPRTKVPSALNRIKGIRLPNKRARAATKKQRNIIAIREAAKRGGGRKFIYLELQGNKRAIFKILGRKKVRIRMVYDLSRRSVTIPKSPWLEPSVAATGKELDAIHLKSVVFQLKRFGLFQG